LKCFPRGKSREFVKKGRGVQARALPFLLFGRNKDRDDNRLLLSFIGLEKEKAAGSRTVQRFKYNKRRRKQ